MTSRTLVRALAREGLELAGVLGAGGTGARMVARDADGEGWAVTVVAPGEMARDALRARVRALAGVTHPHLARVGPLLELRDGTAVALQSEVVGPDLAMVCRARGRWRPGEVVTLVVPLAQALAEMHATGLAHGDVAPANVVLERDGRPVLVDLVLGARSSEAGTPGLAAPERAVGATPAGDVHALARLGLALLADPAADDTDAARLRGVLEGAAAVDPCDRPDAATLAALAYGACAPEPVRLPDPATLARLTLRRLAAPQEATVVRPELAPPGRARHRGTRRRVRSPVVVAAVGALLTGLVLVLGRPGSPAGAAEAPVDDVARVTRSGAAGAPLAAAVRLTVRRAHALGARDPVALASVTVPGSDADRADRALAARLWSRAPDGEAAVRTVVTEARVLGAGGGHTDGPWRARVLVRSTSRLAAGDQGTGQSGEARDARGATGVVLVLDAGPTGWRVSAVEPVPS